jgi:hypothetical protein
VLFLLLYYLSTPIASVNINLLDIALGKYIKISRESGRCYKVGECVYYSFKKLYKAHRMQDYLAKYKVFAI